LIAEWRIGGLNGLLLLALTFALERVFNAGVSLGTLLFLPIDPTVAAHLPVVMTDLPVALLGINFQGSFGGTDFLLPTLS
jgi:hypothetical protein